MSDTLSSPLSDADALARAVLYEGYLLYPYRLSSLKNRQRWTFGVLFPLAYCERNRGGDASMMQTECLLNGNPEARLAVKVQFLQDTGSKTVEREFLGSDLRLDALVKGPATFPFAFSGLCAVLKVGAKPLALAGAFQLTVRICNESTFADEGREQALRWSLLSTQALLEIDDGFFYSLIDPPGPLAAAKEQCRNIGAWPVLIGSPGENRRMLSAPIILPDYPRIAPQSPGDLFDNTEIDEILSLRIQTLTPEEKRQAAESDERAGRLVLAMDNLPRAQLERLHGAVHLGVQPGDRVRLKPKQRADIFDLALAGRCATVCSIERDLEDQIYACVVVDGDPGSDLGREGKPGHRFFFFLEELEKL